MLRRGFGLIAIGTALALGTGVAVAEGQDRRATDAEVADIMKKLESLGYKEVRDIEVDDGLFEADATSPDGHRVELQLDLETLEFVGRARD
jgi:hypothetical protein